MNYTKRKSKLKILSIFISMLLMLCISFSAHALDLKASSIPAYLTEPGEVNIVLRIENNSNATVKEMTLLSETGSSRSIGDIEPKQIINVTVNDIQVNEEDFDNPPIWSIEWREGEEVFSQDFPLPVTKNLGEAKIKISSTTSRDVIRDGDSVELSYTIKNEGDFELTEIRVSDEAVEGTIKQGFSLAPGESASASATISPKSTTVSIPRVSAIAPDGTEITAGADKKEIVVASDGLNIAVNEKSRGDGKIVFNVHLINQGTVDLSDIKVINEEGVLIKDGITLAADQEENIDYTLDDKGEMEIVVEALYVAKVLGDEEQSVSSTPLHVLALYSPEEISLTGKALLVSSKLDTPGPMNVKIELENNSPVELKNLVIKEELAGTLYEIETMQPGAESVDVELEVTQSRDLSFSITYEDMDGRPYTSALAPVSVIVEETALIVSNVDVDDVAEQNDWMLYLMVALGFIAIIIAISIIGLLIKRSQAPHELDDLNTMISSNNGVDIDDRPVRQNMKKVNPKAVTNPKAREVINQSNMILDKKDNNNKAPNNNGKAPQNIKARDVKIPPVIAMPSRDNKTNNTRNKTSREQSRNRNTVPKSKGQMKINTSRQEIDAKEKARRANLNAEIEYKQSLERIKKNAESAKQANSVNESANKKAVPKNPEPVRRAIKPNENKDDIRNEPMAKSYRNPARIDNVPKESGNITQPRRSIGANINKPVQKPVQMPGDKPTTFSSGETNALNRRSAGVSNNKSAQEQRSADKKVSRPKIGVETVVETVVEPVVGPATEQVWEPVVETVVEPVVETVVETVVEPVVETVVKSKKELQESDDIMPKFGQSVEVDETPRTRSSLREMLREDSVDEIEQEIEMLISPPQKEASIPETIKDSKKTSETEESSSLEDLFADEFLDE